MTTPNGAKRKRRDAVWNRSQGLLYGSRILQAYLEEVLQPITLVVDEPSADHGGQEPNFVRHHLIKLLQETFRDILGRKAAATANGPFVRLVNAVFLACGIETDGIEKAIERVIHPTDKSK